MEGLVNMRNFSDAECALKKRNAGEESPAFRATPIAVA
jgi:hypothetical protein